jgi:hypothetical protein
VADLSLLVHLAEGAEGFFERSAWIDSMQLVEVDALKLEAAQTHFDALNQIAGTANVFGFGRALAGDAALGCDDKAGRVGVQGPANEALGDLWAVSVGGIDESDSKLDGAAENAAGFIGILRLSPRPFADETHRSVTESVDGEIAADFEGAACGG